MSKSYRIRTQPGVDKSVKVQIDQEFDYLEILSLKILQSEIYTRQCADYGVIVGRVSVNNGFGIPNAKVSVFIPIDSEDQSNPVISELYPYKSLSDLNEDGYRYNLLPYKKSYSAHVPTGTFFTRTDVLTDPTLIQVYDKYYKFNAVTNDSGDYMIFGVPVGQQTVVMDVDLSDIGEFSLSPQDLIRMGVATEAQVSGTNFKSSNNLRELPQIITVNKIIEVEPLWGQPEICNLGITRTDFDLSAEANIVIQPTAVFIGSIISGPDRTALSIGCRPPSRAGHLCNLTTGPGEILAIRQTIFQDNLGRPILESFELESGGKVIDENGAWMIDVPMNLDYYITNEFGEQVLSNDPEKGIPTKSKYRFKVKWNQSNSLSQNVRRAHFLVPNIRENQGVHEDGSYAFSVDWDEYALTGTSETNQIIQYAIDCEDRFYMMQYNKVYTVSQFISAVRSGNGFERYIGIKNILDDTCTTSNYTFPTNDGNFRFDILYIIFMFFSLILSPIMYAIVILLHFLYFVIKLLRILLLGLSIYYGVIAVQVGSGAFGVSAVGPTFSAALLLAGLAYGALSAFCFALWLRLMKMKLKTINLPILTYPECSLCDCKQGDTPDEEDPDDEETSTSSNLLVPCSNLTSYKNFTTLTLNPGLKQLFAVDSFKIPVESPTNPNGFQNQTAKAFQDNMTGHIYNFQYASNNIGAPFLNEVTETLTNGGTRRFQIYTTALPFADRINLFNLKSKYFNNSTNNPGGGVNRISVNFNPQETQKHYDNTIVILCNPESLSKLNAGQLISFQDPTKSKDINTIGGTLNIYGNKAITGITSTGQTNITVNYARFNGSGNNSITYSVRITAETTNNYHKFPTDIEYFQVITGMTYNQFSGQCSTTTNYNTLNNRYLNNTILMGRIAARDENDIFNVDLNPIQYVEDYENLCVLILNRGVDPYTPKVPIKYGLGILFGYSGVNATEDITVQGEYHMNIPIQGGFKNISHKSSNYTPTVINGISAGSNVSTDTYTNNNQDLFFNSFSYKPQKVEVLGELTGYTYGIPFTYTGVIVSKYSGFNSNLISFYSSMDNNSPSNVIVNCGGQVDNVKQQLDNEVINLNSNFGIQVSNSNRFSWRIVTRFFGSFGYNWLGSYPGVDPSTGLPITIPIAYYSVNTQYTQGYFKNEIVEGGPIMFTNLFAGGYIDDARVELKTDRAPYSVTSNYFSPIYNTTGNTLNFSLGSNDNQIVMRADRLPTSTNVEEYCCNGMVLQKNNNFQIFIIPESGVLDVTSTEGSSGSVGSGELEYAQSDLAGSTGITRVLNSFTCQGSVNLDCYDCEKNGPNGTIKVNDGGCRRENGKVIFEFGCYKLITTIFISLPRDLALTAEWIARNLVLLGACRNVFSHRFVNNWVNGTLYAFPFKNEVRRFTSPLSNPPNAPIPDYCEDVIKLHPITRNYYYRCTKYNLQNDSFERTADHIGYPTTMIDLGPRNNFIQELVMSDEYDGYVVNKLDPSTFGNVDDILNLFIISRFIDNTFLSNLLGGLNIFSYFTNGRRNNGVGGTRGLIDSDYSQMISINSEFGVAPFEAANYPDTTFPGEQNPIYFNCNDVIGIFYSSDTQSRDYITPKRTIINSSVPITSNCSFNNFAVFSQRVPLSQWLIDGSSSDSIFGKSSNNWDYIVDGEVFSHRYQSLDRLLDVSRYFKNTNISQTKYQKGYIYAVKSSSTANSIIITAERQYWDFNNPDDKLITVGAPFHFYFGLKRGASSFDRFRTKWINSNTITN
jgi:hypothetical protein